MLYSYSFLVVASCGNKSLQCVNSQIRILGQELVRIMVEPCALCHVHIVCLGIVRWAIYILGVNMSMGGAMRGWYYQVFYFGVYMCLLMCGISWWDGLVGCKLVHVMHCYSYWYKGCLHVYLCNMILVGANYHFLSICIHDKSEKCFVCARGFFFPVVSHVSTIGYCSTCVTWASVIHGVSPSGVRPL